MAEFHLHPNPANVWSGCRWKWCGMETVWTTREERVSRMDE
jgi:hypothetical protein